MSRSLNAKRNMLWGCVNKIVFIVFPFISRTALLKILGEEYLGLNGLFSSILQVLSLSELGFSMAMVYSMYKPIAEGDDDLVCALLKLYRKIYRIIGCFIFCAGLVLIPFLEDLIRGSYPEDINLVALYLIYLVNTVVSYWIAAYRASLFVANQRMDVDTNIHTVCSVLMYSLQIGCLLVFRNYYAFIIWMPVFTTIKNIIEAILSKKYFPQYCCRGDLPKDEIQKIKTQIFALMGHKIGAVVLSASDNIVISAFIGLASVAMYNNYFMLITAVGSILNIIYTSITASVGNSIVKETVDKNYNDFSVLTFINMWIIGWFAICFACLFQPFMIIWVGEQSLFPYKTVLLFVIYFIVLYARKIVNTYKDACGMWMADVGKPYVEAFFNLAVNICLVQIIGINGVVISSIIAMGFISLPWEAHVLFKKYFKKKESKYYKELVWMILTMSLGGIVTYLICSVFPMIGVIPFIIKMLICALVPNVLFVLLFSKNKDFVNAMYFLRSQVPLISPVVSIVEKFLIK